MYRKVLRCKPSGFALSHFMRLYRLTVSQKCPCEQAFLLHGIIKSNEFQYLPTSGAKLTATSGKTTTVLGSYQSDMRYIVQELGNVKSTDFGPKDGGFNILNVPDDMYKTPEQFWNEVNKPWLIEAIARGDDIVLATKPTNRVMRYYNKSLNKWELTGFGREYEFLLKNGYHYDAGTNMMKRLGE